MKTEERVALIYGASVLGAAAVSYWRGRRGTEIFYDAAIHGAVAGTVFNIIGYLTMEDGTQVPLIEARENEFEGSEFGDDIEGLGEEAEDNSVLPSLATPNFGHKTPPNYDGMGVLSDKAVALLAKVNSEQLYEPMKSGGVKVAPVPENPNIVNQDAT
jgi:hypothetical protein